VFNLVRCTYSTLNTMSKKFSSCKNWLSNTTHYYISNWPTVFFVAFQNRKPPPRVKSDDDVLTFSTSYLEGMCAS